jgi:hypothetical protein
MRFIAAAAGFKSELHLKQSLEWLREGHIKNIAYIKDGFLIEDDYVNSLGLFDYYTILGRTTLTDILLPDQDLPKEELLHKPFSLKNYFYEEATPGGPWENSFTLSNAYYIIINKIGLHKFDADGVPGSIKEDPDNKNSRDIIWANIPLTYVDIMPEMTTWDKLKPLYRIYNEFRMSNDLNKVSQDVYLISMHC